MARPRSKSGTWTKVPNWVFAVLPMLKPRAQAALFVLAAEGVGATHLRVAKVMGVDPRTAKRAIEDLIKAGVATFDADVGLYRAVAPCRVTLGASGGSYA